MELPETSYLIGANQRSGTTLLGRALSDTGVAGSPQEYFLAVDEMAMPHWRCWEEGPLAEAGMTRAEYLQSVYRLGSTPNGVFGAKLMWNNVRWPSRSSGRSGVRTFEDDDVFRTAFPGLRAVLVTRRDRARQAVSWARAAGRVWVVSDTEPARPQAAPEYDAELIANLERLIIEGERGWRQLLGRLRIEPLELVHEDIAYDLAGAVWSVIDHLGLPSTATPS